jgi:hypothetical protein
MLDPDVGLDAALGRDRTVIDRLPDRERGIGAGDDAFIEGEIEDGDQQAG